MDEFESTVAVEPINPLWRLDPFIPLGDAAALVAGYEPTQVGRCQSDTYFELNFPDYRPVVMAMIGAVMIGELDAQVEYRVRKVRDLDPVAEASGVTSEVDPSRTRIRVDDIRSWLELKGHRTGFFFPEAPADTADYLDSSHSRHAPKLAAAVRAWQAVTDLEGKTPKQALMKWLRENGAKFQLTDDEGRPNEQGIEECAKVANWAPGGGASKTPG